MTANRHSDTVLDQIRYMHHRDFEAFVADLWRKKGWNATVSPQSGDDGVDVLATRSKWGCITTAIQAKKYGEETRIDKPELREYAYIKIRGENIDEMTVVTSSSFTSGARELADKENIVLINGDDLTEEIADNNWGSIVNRYAPTPKQIGIDGPKNQLIISNDKIEQLLENRIVGAPNGHVQCHRCSDRIPWQERTLITASEGSDGRWYVSCIFCTDCSPNDLLSRTPRQDTALIEVQINGSGGEIARLQNVEVIDRSDWFDRDSDRIPTSPNGV